VPQLKLGFNLEGRTIYLVSPNEEHFERVQKGQHELSDRNGEAGTGLPGRIDAHNKCEQAHA
jgi:hypothetical protein